MEGAFHLTKGTLAKIKNKIVTIKFLATGEFFHLIFQKHFSKPLYHLQEVLFGRQIASYIVH